ncbi:hypothetical protein ACFP3I_11665 [Chryseobacterium arachidis]
MIQSSSITLLMYGRSLMIHPIALKVFHLLNRNIFPMACSYFIIPLQKI